jgi:hypothetical protein
MQYRDCSWSRPWTTGGLHITRITAFWTSCEGVCCREERQRLRHVSVPHTSWETLLIGRLQEKKELEWLDRVELVFGDMRTLDVPAQADILVSELLGSFGDNELSPECLDGAMRFIKRKYIGRVRRPVADMASIWYIHSSFIHRSLGSHIVFRPSCYGHGFVSTRYFGRNTLCGDDVCSQHTQWRRRRDRRPVRRACTAMLAIRASPPRSDPRRVR